jgi:DNA repair protein RadA/Sms
VPADALFVGEVGLGGEVRPVAALDRRVAEADRLGFRNIFLSARTRLSAPFTTTPVAHVAELTRRLAA